MMEGCFVVEKTRLVFYPHMHYSEDNLVYSLLWCYHNEDR